MLKCVKTFLGVIGAHADMDMAYKAMDTPV